MESTKEIVQQTIQEMIPQLLEGFAKMMFSLVYMHSISGEGKIQLVKEGIKELMGELFQTGENTGARAKTWAEEVDETEQNDDSSENEDIRPEKRQKKSESQKWNPYKGRKGWQKRN